VEVARGADRPGGRGHGAARRWTAGAGAVAGRAAGAGRAGDPLVLGPHALRARLHLPSWYRPGERLPVLLDPYGGASRQLVTAELDWYTLLSQWFAEQGFAVLVVDGAARRGAVPAGSARCTATRTARPSTTR
jgi:dipeptidyl-peptidase-4